MDSEELLSVLGRAAEAVSVALASVQDWGLSGLRKSQYRADLVADEAALEVLLGAGLGALSEESGVHHPDRALFAVLDPLDGSTNASHGVPWFATSICVLDDSGPLAALVVNQASGRRYEALRGKGARRDGKAIAPSKTTELRSSLIAVSGYPRRYLGWAQYRVFGAAALDLCLVADGTVDAYLDPGRGAHGPWDYLGAALICREAGAVIEDLHGRELVERGHEVRRGPVAAANPTLLGALASAARASLHETT